MQWYHGKWQTSLPYKLLWLSWWVSWLIKEEIHFTHETGPTTCWMWGHVLQSDGLVVFQCEQMEGDRGATVLECSLVYGSWIATWSWLCLPFGFCWVSESGSVENCITMKLALCIMFTHTYIYLHVCPQLYIDFVAGCFIWVIPFAAIGAECPGKDQCFGSRHSGRISLSDVAHVADTCHGQNYGALPTGNGHQIYTPIVTI